MEHTKLLIVGNPEPVHVGAHFLEAANSLSLEARIVDIRDAFEGPRWIGKINWWLRGRLPTRLRQFGVQVLEACSQLRPQVLLATGMAPLDAETLGGLGELKVRRCNFLTDDPWNPAHRASWFLKSLKCYDHVFSTRRANLNDLQTHGCRRVSYLPFAYSPSLHYSAESGGRQERTGETDLIFAGGADRDRVPYLAACIQAGFRVSLLGGYWERYPATRQHAGGIADPNKLREALSSAKVSLCLVRRANRDGHVMRTFELPALGVCMLTEDTEEHRSLLGADGENVVYFRTPEEAVDRLRWLISHDHERSRLAANAHRLIVKGKNTYRDRLQTILAAIE